MYSPNEFLKKEKLKAKNAIRHNVKAKNDKPSLYANALLLEKISSMCKQ
jgi:hypothetical protein